MNEHIIIVSQRLNHIFNSFRLINNTAIDHDYVKNPELIRVACSQMLDRQKHIVQDLKDLEAACTRLEEQRNG